MFFHVDEAGNTGNNLFDANQPMLSYGLLSSRTNVDVMAAAEHARILKKIGAQSIHASKLGAEGLASIGPDLASLQAKFDFQFDLYFIDKKSYAVAMLFDAVFDAGLNEAVPWMWYWSPLRFPLLSGLARFLDETTLREGWGLRLLPLDQVEAQSQRISQLLRDILAQIEPKEMDKRFKEVITDGLNFGIQRPADLDFGIDDPLRLSPNAVCFQFVVTAISRHLKRKQRKALGITVDRQTQFNPAQLETYFHMAKKAETFKNNAPDRQRYLAHPLYEGVREDSEVVISHFPTQKVVISPSPDCIGLQLVDVYLWIANRMLRNKEVPLELFPIANVIANGSVDGISIDRMMSRWNEFERRLPNFDDLSEEKMKWYQGIVDAQRERVRQLGLRPA